MILAIYYRTCSAHLNWLNYSFKVASNCCINKRVNHSIAFMIFYSPHCIVLENISITFFANYLQMCDYYGFPFLYHKICRPYLKAYQDFLNYYWTLSLERVTINIEGLTCHKLGTTNPKKLYVLLLFQYVWWLKS